MTAGWPVGPLELLRYGAARHAASTVTTIRDGESIVLTFAEIWQRAQSLARGLAAAGVRAGDVVSTCARNHHEHLESLWASHLLGTCFTPLNPRSDDKALGAMIATARPVALLADARDRGRLDAGLLPPDTLRVGFGGGDDRWRGFDSVVVDGRARHDALAVETVDEDGAAAVLFTGGTTGTPKGAVYSRRALYLNAMALTTRLGTSIAPGDTALILVPMFHAMSWQFPHQAWVTGADLVFVDGPLPAEAVLDALVRTGSTLSAAVPTVWHDVVALAHAKGLSSLGRLHRVHIGGAMCPPALPGHLAELGVASYVGWGMTETLPATMALVASPRPDDQVEADPRSSRPVPGVEVRTVDDDQQVTTGPGHFQIRAPWITGQYLGQPTPDTPWFDTGDDGVVAADGRFTILGRTKEMIKSGGEAIWPGAIEDALMDHPDVVEAAVIEIPHERWGAQPLACVVVRPDTTAVQLRDFLLNRLPKWQVPTVWAFPAALPRTAAGKFDKRVLSAGVEDSSLPTIVT